MLVRQDRRQSRAGRPRRTRAPGLPGRDRAPGTTRSRPGADRAGGGDVDARELELEELSEEVVVAIPVAGAVEPHEEAVRAARYRAAALRSPTGRAPRRRAPALKWPRIDVSSRNWRDLGVERVEHLARQVVHDVPVVAVEVADVRRRVDRGRAARAPRGTGRPATPRCARPAARPRPSSSEMLSCSRAAPAPRRRVNARSRARSSPSAPRPRSRPSGSAGSERVVAIDSRMRGRCSIACSSELRHASRR